MHPPNEREMSHLPIEDALPELRAALSDAGAAVLQAPPGAGKTTRVPPALLGERWMAGQRMVMLEPRRLAARAAAARMASTLGERVGDTVGHRMRMDTRVGPRTRIEVVTEGVLTRMLQSDPALEGVGLLIFDEFHERSLNADLGLALTLQSRAVLRPDLRILVMSATLHGAPVAELLGGAPVITSEGRAWPVETRYLDRAVEGRLPPAVASAVRRALDADAEGDVLVFLPGAGEIRQVESMLVDGGLEANVRVAPLHGSLPAQMQDLAIAPSAPGRRKVVLATSIAETSLTIEGVRVVVDCGWMRVPRFAPRTGMTRLETVRVSRASADQRRGRAGRVGPGVCWRLWPEHLHASLPAHGTPEILDADLAPLALELAAWGVADPAERSWLDAPPTAAFSQARELLRELDAVDPAGSITAHGRRMAELALHPRLAHMLLRAKEIGHGAVACALAALLGDRDVLRTDGGPAEADLRLRLHALRNTGRGGGSAFVAGGRVDREGVRRAAAEAQRWRRELRISSDIRGEVDEDAAAGLVLAFAYPDRIAQRRPGGGGRYLLRNGRGASFAGPDPLAAEPYLVVPELDGQGRDSRVYLAAPVTPAELEEHFGGQVTTEESVAWDADARAVRARRRERLGAIVLREATLRDPDPAAVAAAMLDGIRAESVDALPWTDAARRTRERIAFLHHAESTAWPDVSDSALADSLDDWLAPHLHGIRTADDLRALDLSAALLALLPWDRRAALDELAPTHVTVPSGSRIPVDYSDPAAPVLAVRLQEMFGLADTPRIARGAVALTLHLLSPAHRPVQVTRDLAGFWRGSYFEVRKDLRGRYPRHPWPDDPLAAPATRRAKPRGT
ncbi:MAG: ATP-dependent helicase HrpB [Gemmatimonadetes bacterium]|nr:ATP-dependent helicase HrpB [Gemmatimonadota bacterium]